MLNFYNLKTKETHLIIYTDITGSKHLNIEIGYNGIKCFQKQNELKQKNQHCLFTAIADNIFCPVLFEIFLSYGIFI